MPSTTESELPQTNSSWLGFEALRHLFVFGDSYSAIHMNEYVTSPHPPNDKYPLGARWPGVCFCEEKCPNWVGALVEGTQDRQKEPPLLVFDYAVGGHDVADLTDQVQNGFMPDVSHKPKWASWDEQHSLFVFWVGINDCARNPKDDIPRIVTNLIKQARAVYESGARNFLFIDLPPIDRSPAVLNWGPPSSNTREIYTTWNTSLAEQLEEFKATFPLAKVFTFSSYHTFTRILDDPSAYGMAKEDVATAGGEVWVDHLHPTSAVHAVLARELEAYLVEQQPSSWTAEPTSR